MPPANVEAPETSDQIPRQAVDQAPEQALHQTQDGSVGWRSISVFVVATIAYAALGFVAAGGLPVGRIALLFAVVATVAHGALFLRNPALLTRRSTLIAAFCAHGLLIAAAPLFSDDVYRYLVDGIVGANGIHPFAYAPSSAKIADLVGPLALQVNHADLHTIYPPFAQAAFTLNGFLGGSVVGWKLLSFACLAGACWALSGVWPGESSQTTPDNSHASDVDHGKAPSPDHSAEIGETPVTRKSMFGRHVAAAFFCHPLVVLSVSGDGHVDIVGVFALCLGLMWLARAKLTRFVVALGLAASVKLFPVGLAVALLGKRGFFRSTLVGVGAVIVLVVTYLPLANLGSKTMGSLGTYADTWEYNAGPAALIVGGTDALLEAAGVNESFEVAFLTARNERSGQVHIFQGAATHAEWWSRSQLARRIGRLVGFGIVGLVALWMWRRRKDPVASMSAIMVALFITSPVVHPWYLLWVLPCALLARDRVALMWCGTIVLAFYAPAAESDGLPWMDPVWIRAIEYGLVAATALYLLRPQSPWNSPTEPAVAASGVAKRAGQVGAGSV